MILKTADIIVCEPHQHCISLAAWFDNFLKPQVQRIMQIDVGQNGGNYTALRSAGYRENYPAVFLKYSGLQPFPDQTEKGTVIDPLFQHFHATSRGQYCQRIL